MIPVPRRIFDSAPQPRTQTKNSKYQIHFAPSTPNSDPFTLLRCHRATHIGKFFQLRLSNHHDPVIRTLAKSQLDAWRGIVKVEQSNYYTKALAMKILRQQEREELELQIVQRQKIKPTLDRTQVKLLPVRY